MILEKNNLQTAQKWVDSYSLKGRVNSFICRHQKTSHYFRSHLTAIIALDHRRLIRPGKKKIRPNLFAFDKFTLQNLAKKIRVRVNQPFIPFIHHMWGETVLWGNVFIIQTSDRMQYFTILQNKLHSFNIQDDRSTRGLLAKPLKKFPKTPIRPAGSHFCSASCGECLNEH